MVFDTICGWFALRTMGSRADKKRRKRPAWTRLAGIDPLEDRRLLSVSPTGVSAAETATAIVGRSIFYNNSRFDGQNPAPNASDASAIAADKSALLPGQTATYANYTNYLAGINGIMVDIAGSVGNLTLNDFVFHVGNNNSPSSWAQAPQPSGFSVQAGAGANGSTRVTVVWPDGLIRNQWLQVDVRATAATGLTRPDVFYFGNAVGDTGNSPLTAQVNATDQLQIRANAQGLGKIAPTTSRYDLNRDGLVNSSDELIARSFFTTAANALPLIKPATNSVWSDVVGRYVFYNNSAFDGNNAGANADDDGAIAPDKQALMPGQSATLGNYTSYTRGINGIMIDVAGNVGSLSLDDFEFRVGNDGGTGNWAAAPAPGQLLIRPGAGVGGSTRVTLIWPDGAIAKQWLQVVVKANARTLLSQNDVFYFGNAIGDTGDSQFDAQVTTIDMQRVAAEFTPGPVDLTNLFDLNRDGVVDTADRNAVFSNLTNTVTKLVLLGPAAQPATQTPGSSPAETAYTDFVTAQVVGRSVFYNDSELDGNDPRASAADDNAIATDKKALLPGQTASLANYTSYSRGLNSIMIDVAGLPGQPTLDDFNFRVGNSNTPDQWTAAPAPIAISVRPGAGVGGSARITLVWGDNVIQNSWLQVTIKASARTGLKQADVFYFGNTPGESGNNPANAKVDISDQLVVRNHEATLGDRVPVTDLTDFNRDGIVDTTDEWIAIRNASGMRPLQLITVPSIVPAATPEREQVELFQRGDSGFNVFFGPNLVTTADGTILAIAEGRWGDDDNTSYAIVMRRSTDGGATWSSISTIYAIDPYTTDYIGNPSAVVDATTGQVFVLFVKNTSLVYVTSSTDDGLSWSVPQDITTNVKVTAAGNPNPAAFPSDPWGWYVVGPGHGIQLQQGPHAGRLLISGDHRLSDDRSGPSWSQVIYSDDHGRTWHLGGGVDQTNPDNDYANESALVEQSDGGLYMTIRINNGSPYRGYARSYDGGLTWTDMQVDQSLTTYPVQASLLRIDANTVLLSAPDSSDGTRHQITIWVSHDNTQTWVKTKAIYFGYAGYSDMTLVGPDTVLLAYNRGHATGGAAESIGMARFDLAWLESSDPYQFTWHFNEGAPGQAANIDGTSIQDVSPWDNRAQALADMPADAPTYVAGPNGHTALRLTDGSDRVLLTPASTNALQLEASDSLTVELVLRTQGANGVIIGGTPGGRGWTLQLVNGAPQLVLFDGANTTTLTSRMTINDGNWHRLAVVRDAATKRLTIYVDGVQAAPLAIDQTTQSLASTGAVTLGSMNDGSRQLAFDVDLLRVTRAALPRSQFVLANFVEPPRYTAPAFRSGAPSTLAGLQFWLPSYDPTRYYGDLGYSDPLPLQPVEGTATRSAIDASSNQYRVTVGTDTREVLYTTDDKVGASWQHDAVTSSAGEQWVVQNSNGTSPQNFDFVQNTGVFTLSTFVKLDGAATANMALFDTAESTSVNSGFSLLVTPDGRLTMLVVGPSGTIRFNQSTAPGLVQPNLWYHMAVVGDGPGRPVTFYITAVDDPTVNSSQSTKLLTGDNGNYATDANHNLTIGSLSNNGNLSFRGQMVDEAIYNRALSAADIQQLFNYTVSGKN